MSEASSNSTQSKRNFLNLTIIVSLLSFLILAILVGGSVVYFQYLRYRNDLKTSKIEITGVAEKKVKYDKLTFGFVVSKTGSDSAELNKSVDELTVKAQDILAKNSIKKDNIQTSKNSYPDYSDLYSTNGNPDGNRIKNITFETRFTVKIDDLQNNLDLPNKLTKDLTALGVNQFDPYGYEIVNLRSICDELKNIAIQNARQKSLLQIKSIGGTEIVSTQIQVGDDICASQISSLPFPAFDRIAANSDQTQTLIPEIVTGEKNVIQQVSVNFEYR